MATGFKELEIPNCHFYSLFILSNGSIFDVTFLWMDGVWEASRKPSDTRAAAHILQEAGGRVTGIDGQKWIPDEGHILATNGVIHEEVIRILRQ